MKRIIALCLIIFLSFSSGANAWWELEEFRTELERRLNEKRIGDEEFIQPLQRILGAPEAIEAVRGRDIDALNDIMLTQLVHMMPKQAHDVAEVLQEVMDAADPIPGPVAAGRGDDAPEPVRAGGQIASLIIYDVIKDIAPTLAERIYTYAEGDRQPLLEQHDRRRTEVVARIQKYLENPGNHYAILHGDVDHFINDVFPTSVSRDISPSERRHYERLVGQIKIHAYEEQSRRRKEEASERAAGAERARNARTPEEAYRQALTPRQLFSLGINKGLAAWQRLVSSQDNAGINLDDRQKMFYEDKLLAYARDPANYQHMRDLNGQHLKAYMEAQHPSSPNGQVPQIKLTVSDYRDLL
ncbi:MAG: hypothetical protein LBT58_02970, partial [Endomicrobium sp.]|nr:hypothetical protein [Endomicrobium sp.]